MFVSICGVSLCTSPLQVVIADESHFLKNAQAKRTTASLPVIKVILIYHSLIVLPINLVLSYLLTKMENQFLWRTCNSIVTLLTSNILVAIFILLKSIPRAFVSESSICNPSEWNPCFISTNRAIQTGYPSIL